jgi:hypothetical protein
VNHPDDPIRIADQPTVDDRPNVVAMPGVKLPEHQRERMSEMAAELRAIADRLDAGEEVRLVCMARMGDGTHQLLVNAKPPLASILLRAADKFVLDRYMEGAYPG